MRDVIFFLVGALVALLFAHGVLWWERRRVRQDRERWDKQQALGRLAIKAYQERYGRQPR